MYGMLNRDFDENFGAVQLIEQYEYVNTPNLIIPKS